MPLRILRVIVTFQQLFDGWDRSFVSYLGQCADRTRNQTWILHAFFRADDFNETLDDSVVVMFSKKKYGAVLGPTVSNSPSVFSQPPYNHFNGLVGAYFNQCGQDNVIAQGYSLVCEQT